ncbi:tail fiber [Escherichia phage pEC-N1203-2Af.1]|nr:tail fiber [Escherichia phage pEC-N1203-2Af.1]
MIVYNNQAPDAVNNVGQFGATEGSIGAYKQAAEYAADSKYWALLAESKFGTIDDLIAEVERLYQQGVLMKQDIEDLKQDFIDQDARLMSLVAQTNAAVSDANNAVALINQKLIEVQKQLDVLLGMSVDVTTLPPGSQATGSFNPTTGVISLGIPEGDPGKDGSVKDLDTAPTGVPELGDLGFYVDKDDNTVHKTTLENIANLIPSVRSVSVNGGTPADGEVNLVLDKTTVGLNNVVNVASYSISQVDGKVDGYVKTYRTKAAADADAVNRKVGENILVWEDYKYVFYTVAADKTLTLSKTENRIVTVNSRVPDSTGNIDITIPTGNPSLYLGEMLMFPYDPAKQVSYPGVLPADGRLVSKDNAADLGPSLVSGQLPVVSETAWQAGAKQYFSWGKLADGVTDADSTNFINIRLPDWTGGEAIRSPSKTNDTQYDGRPLSQVPYVVAVNGKIPNEATGNVTVTASDVGALPTTGGKMTGHLNLSSGIVLTGTASSGTSINIATVATDGSVLLGSDTVKAKILSSDVPVYVNDSGEKKFYTEANKPTPAEIGAAAITSAGVNGDITKLEGLVGPTRLGGDAVSDLDAVTLRQLRNQGGGGGGASLNGVSNFNIGDFRLVDSRALIHSNDVTSDGQLLSRTAYPDLWAYAQALSPITDAAWLADPQQRGKYSLGDGSTTFRVPDRNGVQSGSISGLYARGDGGVSSNNGKIFRSAAPNIVGEFVTLVNDFNYGVIGSATGAMQAGAQDKRRPNVSADSGLNTAAASVTLDASISSSVYGRDNTTEVRTNSFTGVWVIRANGGFTAANTSWSVINSDATKPSTGFTVSGGLVRSEYKIGTDLTYSATLSAYGQIDGASGTSGAKILNGSQEWKFNNAGTLVLPNAVSQLGTERPDGALTIDAYLRPTDLLVRANASVGVAASERNGMRMINFNQTTPGYVSYFSGDWYDGSYTLGGVRGTGTDLIHAQIAVNNGQGVAADFKFMPDGTAQAGNWSSTSDERLKTNIKRIENPIEKLKAIKGVTWERLDKLPKPNGIGFLAQDVEKVFPDAVKALQYSDTELKDGTIVKDVKSVDTYGVAAALHHEVLLVLLDRIEALEKEVNELRAR